LIHIKTVLLFVMHRKKSVYVKAADEELIASKVARRIEFKYGAIREKAVLYRGHDTVIDGIKYLNVERYLEQLGNN